MPTALQTPARAARMAHPARAAQLLDVVEKLALGEGLASVTMQRIADLAGVAKPVVYRHFANASEALLAVLERRWAGDRHRPPRRFPSSPRWPGL